MNKDEWAQVRGIWRELGLDRSAPFQWQKRRKIPADRIVEIERLTGIPRQRLRPDLYGVA